MTVKFNFDSFWVPLVIKKRTDLVLYLAAHYVTVVCIRMPKLDYVLFSTHVYLPL